MCLWEHRQLLTLQRRLLRLCCTHPAFCSDLRKAPHVKPSSAPVCPGLAAQAPAPLSQLWVQPLLLPRAEGPRAKPVLPRRWPSLPNRERALTQESLRKESLCQRAAPAETSLVFARGKNPQTNDLYLQKIPWIEHECATTN